MILVKFIRALGPAVHEAWLVAQGKICSRSCSEMHTEDKNCILAAYLKTIR